MGIVGPVTREGQAGNEQLEPHNSKGASGVGLLAIWLDTPLQTSKCSFSV